MLGGCVAWPAEFAERYRARGYWRGETLGQLLRARAQQTPAALAVIDGERRWTYQELDLRADRLAAGLRRLGLRAHERVLVQLPNIAEFLPLCFALFRIGAVPVLALPAHRELEIVHLARLSEATTYLIADEHLGFDYRPLARSVVAQVASVRRVVVVGQPEEFIALSELEGAIESLPEPDPSEVALLLLSGGTTGAPKLIPRTHDDYVCNLRLSAEVARLDERSRYLVTLPIAHNFALGCPGALGTMYAGGTVVFCRHPSPELAFPLIEREQVTVTALIPPLVLLWLEAREWFEADLRSLSLLQVGGARLKKEAAARVRTRLGCALQQVYGMAEGLLCFTRPSDPEALVLETQGRALTPDDELRIVDADGDEVAEGEIGELLVRGPYTIRGYYQANEHNARAFTRDGFYRTGDLVRRLPSGHIVVEGRTKDVINRGGEKVPAEEVEDLLLGHPAVRDVALVGIPDATLGERTCACLVARGAPPALAELNAHLARLGLAAFKLPDRLLVLEQLPQTRLGKVDKTALAALAAARLSPARGDENASGEGWT